MITYRTIPYLILYTPPASEPVSLDEVKLYLRLDGNEQDGLLSQLIVSVRQAAEKYLKRSLITQSWLLAFDNCAPTTVLLPKGPVQSVTSVKIVARDGGETILATTGYYLNAGREKLVFDTPPVGHIVEVLYVTGFGAPADVPESVKQGMLSHIADLFDRRADGTSLPQNTINLYAPHRLVSL